jgi:hypothetical protein
MTAATYTTYRVNLDGALSDKEHLNNIDEVNEWMARVYGRFATILVVRDQTGAFRKFTDDGQWWDLIDTSARAAA